MSAMSNLATEIELTTGKTIEDILAYYTHEATRELEVGDCVRYGRHLYKIVEIGVSEFYEGEKGYRLHRFVRSRYEFTRRPNNHFTSAHLVHRTHGYKPLSFDN